MSKDILRIDWATHAAAKYACENWHYSGSIPSASVKVGAWESGKFIGVVIFGRGAASEIGSPYGLSQDKICELVRIALTEHKTETSRILAIAIRFLKKQNPGLKLIVSFADTTQGHHGGIYQANGWIFEGSKEYHSYMVNGQILHPKTLHSKYGKGGQSVSWLQENIDPNAKRINGMAKHKYLMPLDSEMRSKVQHLSKPYPKRMKQAMGDVQSPQRRGSTDPCAPISTGF